MLCRVILQRLCEQNKTMKLKNKKLLCPGESHGWYIKYLYTYYKNTSGILRCWRDDVDVYEDLSPEMRTTQLSPEMRGVQVEV